MKKKKNVQQPVLNKFLVRKSADKIKMKKILIKKCFTVLGLIIIVKTTEVYLPAVKNSMTGKNAK